MIRRNFMMVMIATPDENVHWLASLEAALMDFLQSTYEAGANLPSGSHKLTIKSRPPHYFSPRCFLPLGVKRQADFGPFSSGIISSKPSSRNL